MLRLEASEGLRTLGAELLSRYQTGATAKNRLGGNGGCRGDWKGAATNGTNGFGTGRNGVNLIAGYEAERKTGAACRAPCGKCQERFLGRGALGMTDEFG
jgi:hypothetical protein